MPFVSEESEEQLFTTINLTRVDRSLSGFQKCAAHNWIIISPAYLRMHLRALMSKSTRRPSALEKPQAAEDAFLMKTKIRGSIYIDGALVLNCAPVTFPPKIEFFDTNPTFAAVLYLSGERKRILISGSASKSETRPQTFSWPTASFGRLS